MVAIVHVSSKFVVCPVTVLSCVLGVMSPFNNTPSTTQEQLEYNKDAETYKKGCIHTVHTRTHDIFYSVRLVLNTACTFFECIKEKK